jgi:hypothetical protein
MKSGIKLVFAFTGMGLPNPNLVILVEVSDLRRAAQDLDGRETT